MANNEKSMEAKKKRRKLSFSQAQEIRAQTSKSDRELSEIYGMNFKESMKMDTSLLYEAADTGDLDAIVVFTTDGLLKKYDMTPLIDDKTLFPPYEGAIVCRNDILEKYPELRNVLNILAGRVDDETMQELNYRVDIENRSVEDVAKEFLAGCGLI